MEFISKVYNLFCGDLLTLPLPGGSIGISLLVALLIPAGILFTVMTKCLPICCFPEMLHISVEKETRGKSDALSGMQALIVSTAQESAWAIWWALWLRCPPAAQALCSGCGSPR